MQAENVAKYGLEAIKLHSVAMKGDKGHIGKRWKANGSCLKEIGWSQTREWL